MRLSEMLHEIGNYETGNDFLFKKYLQNEIKGACSDSRKITSGYVFFCIKGARFDGHYYAGDVIAKGCKILVCEHMPAINIPNDVLVLTVADSRKAYAKALSGIYGHPDKKMCMIGITGTKGKTSTALMIKAILTQNNITAGYIGTNGIIFADEHIQSGNTTPDSGDIYYYLSKMLSAYGVEDNINKNFTLQNGYEILSKTFSRVEKLEYIDSLAVTNIDDMVEYIYSLSSMTSLDGVPKQVIKEILINNTTNGILNVPKEYGMFISS